MSADLAIVAGSGALAEALIAAFPRARVLRPDMTQPFEALLHTLTDQITAAGCARVVLAGKVPRPQISAPKGDAALSHDAIAYLKRAGLKVIGAHELLPDLVMSAGPIAGPKPGDRFDEDISYGRQILKALAPHDVGQAVVITNGACAGIETVQGTDTLLKFIAQSTDFDIKNPRGILFKAPKSGQDLRIDMPAIGPKTIRLAHAAGLRAVVITAGNVLVLKRAETIAVAERLGLSLYAVAL